MEFDPAQREGPPPRHQLESDSEDSGDEVATSARRSTKARQFAFSLAKSGSSSASASSRDLTGAHAILLDEEVAQSFLQTLAGKEPAAQAPESVELRADGMTVSSRPSADELILTRIQACYHIALKS